MSVSPAASKSLLLSNFAPASRLAPGQGNLYERRSNSKILNRAANFIDTYWRDYDAAAAVGDATKITGVKQLMEEFQINEFEAAYFIEQAQFQKSQGIKIGATGGGGPVGPIATAPKVQSFGTLDEAKAFAQAAIKLLKVGIERFNKSVLDWSPQKAQEAREKTWQGIFDAFRRVNPEATEEEAIAFADKYLKGYLATEGHMDESVLRDAIERLQSGFVMSGPLYTENADGTLSLNRTELRDRSGNLIFEIGADLGQNVDKAA